MKFSVIIVNYNGGTHIKRCLSALAAQTQRDFEVLIVDNASSDGSENTPVPDARFRWIKAGSNLGFAAGNNLAAKEAKGEWLFMVNPDAFVEPECLATLYAATIRHPDCVVFGCTQLDDANPEILDGTGDCYFFAGLPYRSGKGWPIDILPDEGEVFGACGAATFIRKDVFDALRGYDEDFFCYCEDVDLAFRLRLLNYRTLQISEAMVRHAGSAITGARSEFAVFHGIRNLIWTFLKNAPEPLLWPLLPFHICLVLMILFSRPGSFQARWKGVSAAIIGLPRILKKRRLVQKTRKATVLDIARSFTWNIHKAFWKKPDVRKHITQ